MFIHITSQNEKSWLKKKHRHSLEVIRGALKGIATLLPLPYDFSDVRWSWSVS
jgi:hypothetical protein